MDYSHWPLVYLGFQRASQLSEVTGQEGTSGRVRAFTVGSDGPIIIIAISGLIIILDFNIFKPRNVILSLPVRFRECVRSLRMSSLC